jgi:RNA ligase (TIGR02306 family)
MKLKDNRVRAAKIRGHVSQGLLASQDSILDYFISIKKVHRVGVGDDLTKALQVTKHEPQVKAPRGMNNLAGKPKRYCNPFFSKYTSINHLQKFDTMFKDGEDVLVTEKLHGTNFRAGWVPNTPKNFIQKVSAWLSKRSPWPWRDHWVFVVGSHNVQLIKSETTGFTPAENVYQRVAREHHLEDKIPWGQVWYGEIVGSGIQANYEYGYGPGKTDVFFMDIMNTSTGLYMDFKEVQTRVLDLDEKMVPCTKVRYNLGHIEVMLNYTSPNSFLDKRTYKEGYVVRSVKEGRTLGQRRILKLLSERYLLQKGNTDFH